MWVSLATLASRISILQVFDGLEQQKGFVRELGKSSASHNAKFYAHWWSRRAEDRSTYETFKRDASQLLIAWKVEDNHKTLIGYLLLGELPEPGHENLLLSAAASCSVIDVYEVFFDCVVRGFLEKNDDFRFFEKAVGTLGHRGPAQTTSG